ncbi:hypothetical protein CDD80_2036 [Ophiocordyceps camponoti-rufipedis]|uniref:SAC3/GANP/THP3 conserved domain-containing protein n=1 Tax=Ophiocordyceps camponoti-rufipedis TaxID=2004952 RepID=A0A2C5Z483_9HYPO|nr:hypothetical protein CDD80_2036 [Ophiocordyceps camponoti-rufipedis]
MVPGWSAQAPGVSQPATPPSYAYPANPAFVPVQVRRHGFGNANANAAGYAVADPQPQPAEKAKTDWPESVRSYVQRSFLPANDDPTVSRAELENKLKETIGTAKENGSLYRIDWDSMPLPQDMVKAEREAMLKHGSCTSAVANLSLHALNSKKRKSSEIAADDALESVPWRRSANGRNTLESRISHPERRFATDNAKSSKFQREANKRKRRFENEYNAVAHRSPSPTPPSSGPIVGTSEALEKKYLRLTAPPVASNVRPERILRQTLDLLKKKWRKEGNYSYICDQLKSMRQDLTVQHIKNDFTVSVYELHARIALEKGDIGEYNQCQTQLRSLYGLGLKGNPIEFKAYRILYFLHTANRSGLNDTLTALTTTEKEEKPIKHALAVRTSLALRDHHRFFQLFMDTPNMGAYLMDMFVMRERLAAICDICKGCKPEVDLDFLMSELAFESEAEAVRFFTDHQGEHLLDHRQEKTVFLAGKAGPIFEGAKSAAFRKVDIKGQI